MKMTFIENDATDVNLYAPLKISSTSSPSSLNDGPFFRYFLYPSSSPLFCHPFLIRPSSLPHAT
jgi:hypothetical protein